MLALSPLFPSFGWPLEDPISQQNNNDLFNREVDSSDSLFHSPHQSQPQAAGVVPDIPPISGAAGGDHNNHTTGTVKKLNHNASERDRRKKINGLYSSLFSLLPASDQTKKLSIPATVSCVVKYIPELQREVERLVQKKEELSSRISRQQEDEVEAHLEKKRKVMIRNIIKSSLSALSVSRVGDKDVAIQICCASNANISLLPQALLHLEEDGLLLFNSSSFLSLGDQKLFHNLHFQVQWNNKMELDTIREKILLLYQKSEL